MLFADIVGAQSTQDYLLRTIHGGRVPHAQLLIDRAGGMGMPLALAAITYLYCTQKTARDACGSCRSCKQMEALQHPALFFIFPTPPLTGKGAPKNGAEPLWLDFLREQPYVDRSAWVHTLGGEAKSLQIRREDVQKLHGLLYKKSFGDTYKTFVVWLPEEANLVAANGMLKMVEEPTDRTLFFFITEKPRNILPTLRSRMWQVSIPQLADAEVSTLLQSVAPALAGEDVASIVQVARGHRALAQQLALGSDTAHFR